MSSESSNLSNLARNKLQMSNSKDRSSLHRWVLLKNSIIASLPFPQTTVSETTEEATVSDDEADSFMFPDVGKFVSEPALDLSNDLEAQWLDSLLESLGDDEDFDDAQSISVVDDEEEVSLSPLPSPMSSSDDLTNFYPPPIYPPLTVPYSVPYHHHHFPTSPYDDHPLPYYDIDEMPEAIEDTSDDESEDPPTPSLGRSQSSLSLVDPALIPLPVERSSLRHSQPHIYIDTDDSYFYPLPLYDSYEEC